MFSLKTALSSLLVLFAGCDRSNGTSAHASHDHAPTAPEVIVPSADPAAEALPTVEPLPAVQAMTTAEAVTIAALPRASAETRPAEVKSAGNRAAKKVGRAEYVCPMHPDVVSDRPGLCPKCYMKLELKPATEVRRDSAGDHAGHDHPEGGR